MAANAVAVDWQALIQQRIEVLEFEFDVYAHGLFADGDTDGDRTHAGRELRASDRTTANALAGALMELQMLARYLGLTVHARVPCEVDEDDQRYPSSELFDRAQAERRGSGQ